MDAIAVNPFGVLSWTNTCSPPALRGNDGNTVCGALCAPTNVVGGTAVGSKQRVMLVKQTFLWANAGRTV